MADRLLVDLGDGMVTVTSVLEGGLAEELSKADLAWPLGAGDLEDLRWYLEDYLRAPFGVWQDRGPQIQAGLTAWGQAVFAAVFGQGQARDTYQQLRNRGVELVFRSADPSLLGLPWELMADPAGPVALGLAGVSRALRVAELAATAEVAGDRLRVLMVISRPAGTGDVGYQMIARPLLERLEAVRGQVDLVVLRPPTLDALRQALQEAKAAGHPFQVVHFDGHGAMPDRPAAGGGGAGGRPVMMNGPAAEGVLVFEKPGGGSDPVSASKIGMVLKDAGVPVVVLNACQSGAVGKALEAAVATRLLREGCAAVVAMAYSVYAVAAAEFMAVLYERLFAGDTLSAAVTAGRKQLAVSNLRPSPKGELPLSDWLVPVHYLRRDVAFPQAHTARPAEQPSLEHLLDELRSPGEAGPDGQGSLEPVGVFTGRDDLVFELDTAARLQRVVVLHGPGGTGKTELAKAFGRWWRDTGGVERPDWVIWHSFEPGVASFGLDGVITQVGLAVFGPDFARLDGQERQQVVERLLASRRLLLIWDNFESVHTMPDPGQATLPLDEAGRTEIAGFLARLAGHGTSAVIITSRTPEDWLGPVRRITVGGLTTTEAAQYADSLLAPYPAAAARRDQPVFGELLEWLDGHPLSMRLILPRLQSAEPAVLLDGLRGTTPLPSDGSADGDRGSSLVASISYSFAHLGEQARRLLPAAGLCHGVADADVLASFSTAAEVPVRFAGAGREEWTAVLEEAARVGLLTPLGAGMYQIHPALPAYLAAWWQAEDPGAYPEDRKAAIRALATAYAEFGTWLSQQIGSGNAGLAYAVLGWQRRTMGALLSYALSQQMWAEAQAILQPLDDYWDARGLTSEASAWTDQIQYATETYDGSPLSLGTPAGALWLFITGSQANRQRRARRLDDAEHTYRQILGMLHDQATTPQQQADLAVTYHQLGTVAQDRGQLHQAEEWYRRASAINEALGDRSGMASGYHQLGRVAQDRGELDQAEDWYRQSLAISEALGNRPGMAMSYHQLGIVAELRGELGQAEDWHRQSLAINEALGNRPGLAISYHQLGIVAQARGEFGRAEDWYRQSLAIEEALGNRPGIASSYHQLGRVAELRGQLDQAEGWYRQSLAIREALGDRPGTARIFAQMGLLAQERNRPGQALEYAIRCVSLFPIFPHPSTGTGPRDLARLTAQLGIGALRASWQRVTGQPLPQEVRDYVTTHSGQAG